MKKRMFLAVVVTMLFVAGLEAAVTIRYANKDSKDHSMQVTIAGSTETVEFGSSKTASVTVQGGATECVIETSCGKVTVKDGDEIEIKDGCIEVK